MKNKIKRKQTTYNKFSGNKNKKLQEKLQKAIEAYSVVPLLKEKRGGKDDKNRTMQPYAQDVNCPILEILSLKLQKLPKINGFSTSYIYDDRFFLCVIFLQFGCCSSLHTI